MSAQSNLMINVVQYGPVLPGPQSWPFLTSPARPRNRVAVRPLSLSSFYQVSRLGGGGVRDFLLVHG